ncbi:Rieske (2Fe-2S) protein [Quadrisphaera oryzae]|uniref:Rieske (2Fe-2S) protein n=1 Tax=Quadrisphaera TaxID=317661 RepID=UPI001647E2F7|nr:Rieske 2Fe-2S domain-containing protein [Quadrisphaera sp. RL12-1S]
MTATTTAAAGVRVAALADIPPGEGRAYVVEGAAGPTQVAVFHHRDGRVSAVDAVCPHSGGPLADGQIDSCVVVCPLHLNTWDLRTGASTSGQAPVRVHGVVVIDTPDAPDGPQVHVTPAP